MGDGRDPRIHRSALRVTGRVAGILWSVESGVIGAGDTDGRCLWTGPGWGPHRQRSQGRSSNSHIVCPQAGTGSMESPGLVSSPACLKERVSRVTPGTQEPWQSGVNISSVCVCLAVWACTLSSSDAFPACPRGLCSAGLGMVVFPTTHRGILEALLSLPQFPICTQRSQETLSSD